MLTATFPTSLDIYRDGGSLSVTFMDSEGVERTLLFPVRLAADGARKFERVGYFSPTLEWFVHTSRISHITGLESVDTKQEARASSWEEARRILSELSRFMPQFQTEYAHVFPMMVKVAASDGALGESA